MSNARHAVAVVRPSKKRRGRRIAIVAAALAAIAGIAIAAVMLRADVQGEATVIASDIEWTSVVEVVDNGEITCDASVSDGTLTVDIEGWANTHCDVKAKVISTGDDLGTVVVQDIVYNSTIGSAFVIGCGKTIPTIDTQNTISVRFTIPDGTASGTYPTSSEAALIGVLQEDYVDANCPKA